LGQLFQLNSQVSFLAFSSHFELVSFIFGFGDFIKSFLSFDFPVFDLFLEQ